jgi:translation initiation factor IF-2
LEFLCKKTGKLETLKHVKKDVMEMRKGTECGMGFEEFQDLRLGDQIQAYEEVTTTRSL